MTSIEPSTQKIIGDDQEMMFQHNGIEISGYLTAGNPQLDASLLLALSRAPSYKVRRRIAENACTPAVLLNELALDDHPEVRLAVADNANATQETLERLVSDECPDVRYGLAENPHLPFSILLQLIADDNPYVASRAKKTADRVDHGRRQASSGHTDDSRWNGQPKPKQTGRYFVFERKAYGF